MIKSADFKYSLKFYYSLYKTTDVTEDDRYLNKYHKRLILIIKLTIKSLFFHKNHGISCNKRWLFVQSLNNIESLNFLKESNNNYEYVSILSSTKFKIGVYNYTIINVVDILMYTLNYLFLLIRENDREFRCFIIKYPNLIFTTYLSILTSERIIKKYKPKTIVFANDINFQSRALLSETKKSGVQSVYIQHATVSKLFPELDFDLALLEGQYSIDTYEKSTRTRVELIGQPKFEKYRFLRKTVNEVNVIGVAYNKLDDLAQIYELVHYLQKEKYIVYLRPHPRDNRVLNSSLIQNNVSNKLESSFEFIDKIDLLIASDSSIHLESILLNTPSYYYNLNNNKYYDYYSYVKNNLIGVLNYKEDVIELINTLNSSDNNYIYKKAKYYCYSTDDNINAIDLAVNYINQTIDA